MSTAANSCLTCGGLITQIGKMYGYSGDICYCIKKPNICNPANDKNYESLSGIHIKKVSETIDQLKQENEVLKQFKQEALDMAVSMHIDTMAWNLQNEENTPREILVGWHESNNKKLEQFLAKWKV